MISSEEALQKFKEDFQNSLVIHNGTSWLGMKAQKCTGDAWVYQELIYKLRPTYVVETGTAFGGGAMFLSTICNAVGFGTVITIENDVSRYNNSEIQAQNVIRLLGSSTDESIITYLRERLNGQTVLVILDSDHSYEHVYKELGLYREFIRPGFYMIVEDTHMKATHNAVDEFLKDNNDFIPDKSCEKFLFTFNPGGFLKKI